MRTVPVTSRKCEPGYRLAVKACTCSIAPMSKNVTAQEIIEQLNLSPLPGEGGYFRRTYEGAIDIDGRAEFSVIYYLLSADNNRSALHQLPFDETYHFYLGDPVQMLILEEGKPGRELTLGADITGGQQVQVIAPANCWHGSILVKGGSFALLGTCMTPGYMDTDYREADGVRLQQQYPEFSRQIKILTEKPK